MDPHSNLQYFKDYHGLNQDEVARFRRKHGKNAFSSNKKPLVITLIREVVTEPMFILLSVACGLYLILGEWTEGMMMIIALILVSGISIYQAVRSHHATKALRKMSQTQAKVLRENKQTRIHQEDLVVNDLMIVEEGDLIPADGELMQGFDFSVNESIITGESYSVPKHKNHDQYIFLGSQVVSGYALAKVTKVGDATRMGKLGLSLQEIKPNKTLLQLQIDHFVKSMALFGLIAFILVWLINYIGSKNVYESLLQGLTLAMSALPEEIPVAFSTFMAIGAWRLIRKKILTKQPQTVESLGAASVICLDKTGTITENKMVLEQIYDHDSRNVMTLDQCKKGQCTQVLQDAMLASEVQPFDPMEVAIHQAYELVSTPDIRPSVQMHHEYPLDGQPPMMTHVYYDKNANILVACKGSWEKILKICNLSREQIDSIKIIAHKMASEGMRVLGTAHVTNASAGPFPEQQEDFNWNFSGLIALSDPPKKNIRRVFEKFTAAGIAIKMITGDYPETAGAIAEQSGLKRTRPIILGTQIMEMDDTKLMEVVKSSTIFARMFPEAKLKVINALKNAGEVVAMTGDGVNDGPALKAAEIGIAMGRRGTEIAKRAADIILIDDDLEHMVEAIEAGRKIYYNLKKAFRYIISIHIPIIMVVTLPLVLGWKYPNIFSPIHVIFLELIMGPTCSIIYENEPIEAHIMKKGPRRQTESLFSWSELSLSIFQGLIITLVVLGIYQISVAQNHSENMVRTLTFTCLIFSNIFLTLVNRSFDKSIFQTIKYKNALIPLILMITLVIWLGSIKIEPLRNLFQFDHVLNTNWIILCLSGSAMGVFWIEILKLKWRGEKSGF